MVLQHCRIYCICVLSYVLPLITDYVIGNGEVDFEEFLALMTSTEKYLEALGGELDAVLMDAHACILPLTAGIFSERFWDRQGAEREPSLLCFDKVHEEISSLVSIRD